MRSRCLSCVHLGKWILKKMVEKSGTKKWICMCGWRFRCVKLEIYNFIIIIISSDIAYLSIGTYQTLQMWHFGFGALSMALRWCTSSNDSTENHVEFIQCLANTQYEMVVASFRNLPKRNHVKFIKMSNADHSLSKSLVWLNAIVLK